MAEPASFIRVSRLENTQITGSMRPGIKKSQKPANRAVVIGAGIGGLTAAASLAKAGLDVTVLEAHIYPGGCAGTFFHQGYLFDAGATLAGGFYPGGPMEKVATSVGIKTWCAQPEQQAMIVHLPDATRVELKGDETRWQVRQAAFGPTSKDFFLWQEKRADAFWDLALRLPAWPPQNLSQLGQLIGTGWRWLAEDPLERINLGIAADAFRPAAYHLRQASDRLRLFIDGQLLISAQTTSQEANALYAACALDLPRRGVVHMQGGIGTISQQLAEAVRQAGGQVRYHQEVTKIIREAGYPLKVYTKRGDPYQADLVIANLPAWNLAKLMTGDVPAALSDLPAYPEQGWGAFTLYIGMDGSSLSEDFPLHHQVIVREPLGEGNSVFLSLSPIWDKTRAPYGHRALTISTHTDLSIWWDLFENDRPAYEERKARYTERVLAAAEVAITGLRDLARLILPGTPVTFQRFTRRARGWVGGFPQTSLLNNYGPRLDDDLWMVGDSIFPGQSTAAVALGGLRVAQLILQERSGVARDAAPLQTPRTRQNDRIQNEVMDRDLYRERKSP